MPFSRWEHIKLSNCYHSICPYVLVSGVVDKSTSTFPLNGREVQLLSVKVVARLLDVTASSPQSVTYGWHIRTLFSFARQMKVKEYWTNLPWSEWRDLNPRHREPKSRILPTELHPDFLFFIRWKEKTTTNARVCFMVDSQGLEP